MIQNGEFVLLKETKLIAAAFKDWHEALRGGPELPTSGMSWWIDELGFGVSLQWSKTNKKDAPALHVPGAKLTTTRNTRSKDFVVEINPGSRPGNGHVPSAVAVGPDGKLWLLRQAWLQGKRRANGSEPRIETDEFLARTGFTPVPVKVAEGPVDRTWCIVCPLERGQEEMRNATRAYVFWAAVARNTGSDPADAGSHTEQPFFPSASLPSGGLFTYPGHEGGVGRRLEDEVLAALAERVSPSGTVRMWARPRTVDNYTVDLEIKSADPKLLVEVKSDNSAAHVQQGVGQLVLYPLLLPHLKAHRRVLLLPGPTTPSLEKAIAEAGILRTCYRWTGGEPGAGRVEFDGELLGLFGEAPPEVDA
ncbi:hypothetical protein, partial [Paracraurococcus lichenis]